MKKIEIENILNMNVKLRNGGRKAPMMSRKDFEDLLDEYLEKYADDGECDTIEELIGWFMWSKFGSDRKVDFDTENLFLKYGITRNGVPYAEVTAGGDWQDPVLSYVYYDGKDLRLYIPTKGNCFNRDTKTAFGEDTIEDGQFICKELGIKLGEDFMFENETFNSDDYDDEEEFYEDLIEGLRESDFFEINKSACLEDFESRLTIVK